MHSLLYLFGEGIVLGVGRPQTGLQTALVGEENVRESGLERWETNGVDSDSTVGKADNHNQ